MKWAKAKEAAATSALFILVNSTAGLAGHLGAGRKLPEIAWALTGAVVLAGYAGSRTGSRRLPVRAISTLLAIVLAIASLKLLFG